MFEINKRHTICCDFLFEYVSSDHRLSDSMRCYEECINDLGDQNAVAISLHQKTQEIRSNHGKGKKRENAVTKFLFCRYKCFNNQRRIKMA